MSKYLKVLLPLIATLFILPLLMPVFAQGQGGGPAGVPLIEYMFARVVCVAVPLGYIALLVVLVIAGLKYLTSAGEAKAVQAAHQTVTWGLLGVLFLAIAWLILLLIQNFTGVEVTKFSVSSLPGVQGFTGSCWAEPPVAPNPTPAPIAPEVVTTSNCQQVSGYELPVEICPVDPSWNCDSLQPHFTIPLVVGDGESRPWDTWGIGHDLVIPSLPVIYINTDGIIQLRDALDSPIFINILSGSLDNEIYRNPLSQTLWGKYAKREVPKKLIESIMAAYRVVFALDPRQKSNNPALQKVTMRRLECEKWDYYTIRYYSPLLYFYSNSRLSVNATIKVLTASYLPFDKNGGWSFIVTPDGTLTTQDGQKLRYIPYEFLRSDFKRPEKGVIIEDSKLEEYLRKDLWKTLGLTDSEMADYWLDTKPRVKPAPYYFISLIDRSEIDRVLPLEVNPKPDTVIRNMTYILPLPSEPVITPVPLENEKLIAPEREGFTVLENGVFTDGF